MPNSLPSHTVTTINQSTTLQITTNGTTQTVSSTTTPATSPTAMPTQQKVTIIMPTSPFTFRRITPTPTVKITATTAPTPTTQVITATATPTRVLTVTPTKTPITPTPTTTSTAETVRDYIMNGINTYRKSLGLSSVQISDETCAFAKTRAKEITTDFSHTGFQNRINSNSIPYKSWTLITENLAMTSNYKDVVNMWINSPGHAANMQKDTPYVCVENSGNYYAYEGMRP